MSTFYADNAQNEQFDYYVDFYSQVAEALEIKWNTDNLPKALFDHLEQHNTCMGCPKLAQCNGSLEVPVIAVKYIKMSQGFSGEMADIMYEALTEQAEKEKGDYPLTTAKALIDFFNEHKI